MKTGANNTDIVAINHLTEEGFSPEEISDKLQIDLACVESFVKGVPAESKKGKAKAEKEIVFTD